MPRSHGILNAEYSTDGGGSWVSINDLIAEESSLEPQGPEEPVEDEHGNAYWSPTYWVLNLMSLDQSSYITLKNKWDSDERVRLRFGLENGTTFEVFDDYLVPVSQRTIEGAIQGRSEGFQLGGPDQDVRVRDDDVVIS
jgi:hypothetical protein